MLVVTAPAGTDRETKAKPIEITAFIVLQTVTGKQSAIPVLIVLLPHFACFCNQLSNSRNRRTTHDIEHGHVGLKGLPYPVSQLYCHERIDAVFG
jgi:hypothetical protein